MTFVDILLTGTFLIPIVLAVYFIRKFIIRYKQSHKNLITDLWMPSLAISLILFYLRFIIFPRFYPDANISWLIELAVIFSCAAFFTGYVGFVFFTYKKNEESRLKNREPDEYNTFEYYQFVKKLNDNYGFDIQQQVVILKKLRALTGMRNQYYFDQDYDIRFFNEVRSVFYNKMRDKGIADALNADIINFYGKSHIDNDIKV